MNPEIQEVKDNIVQNFNEKIGIPGSIPVVVISETLQEIVDIIPDETLLVAKDGDVTINNRKTFTQPITVPSGVQETDSANIGNIIVLPNDIRFQRIQRTIPRILVTTTAPGKCKEFLRLVPANNYCFVRIYAVNHDSTVKTFEFSAGYDALSETVWSQLVPLTVYNDRSQDFNIEIKKVVGFGPTNFGILFRYRNTTIANVPSQAAIKIEFGLELPAVGTNYEQFAVLNTPEYTFSGSTTLYGRKLTETPDGLNFQDSNGKKFLKEGDVVSGGAPVDITGKADTTYVNAQDAILDAKFGSYLPASQKGAANGVASLGPDGKVPIEQVSGGAQVYKGTWNAATNTPTLNNAGGTAGWTYAIAVSGTVDLGNGPIAYVSGDDLVHNGTIYQVKPSSATVASVAGKVGTVVLDKTDVGLSNVDNTSDNNKPVSTAQAAAIALKAAQSDLNAHTGNTANPHNTTKAQIGLSAVDNTADADKPISTAMAGALSGKEPTIVAGTTGQYRRGDKTWQTLDKAAVGLSNVDNTADSAKPISSATQTALNAKEGTVAAGTTAQYYRGDKTWQTLGTVILSTVLSTLGAGSNTAVTSAMSIVTAIANLQAQITAFATHTHTTDQVTESGTPTNKWWTNARTIGSVLTGFATAASAFSIAAGTSILDAFGIIQKRLELLEAGDDLFSYVNPVQFFQYDSGAAVMKLGLRRESRLMELLKNLGLSYKGESLLGTYEECVANALNSGTTRYSIIKIDADSVITELGICMRTATTFTTSSGNNKLFLYSLNLTTKVASLVAQTADTPTLFNTAGIRRAALTTPYSAPAGYYVVGVRYETSDQTVAGTILSKVLDGSTMAIIDNFRLAGTASTLAPATVDMQTLNASSASTWIIWN